MTIQNRRGLYADFNRNRLAPGEWAVVLSGDPNSETGRSVYVCFAPGQVERMVTYEDLLENINSLTDEIKELFTADVKEAIRLAMEATTKATQATSAAVEATTKAGQAVANTQGVIAIAEEKIREMQDLIDAGLGGGTGGGGGATGDVKFLTEYIGSGTISDFGESVPIGNVDLTKYSDLVAVFSINDWNEGSEIVLIPNALIESGGYQFSTTLYEQGGLPTIIRYIIGNSQPLGLVVQEYESLGTNPTVHVGFFGRKIVGNVAVGEIGDIASAPVTFTQAGTRTNISSGETLSVIFGKIMRFFTDLGTAAFRGVSNVLTTTAAGVYVLDAFQGKVLKDLHDELKARVDMPSGSQILRGTNDGMPLLRTPSNWKDGSWDGTAHANAPNEVIAITDAPNPNIKYGYRLTDNNANAQSAIAQRLIPLVIGETYTASCLVRKVGSGTPMLFMQFGAGTSFVATPLIDITSETWVQKTFTFKPTINTGGMFFGSSNASLGVIEICGMTLTRGSIPIDGQPSALDIQGDIADIQGDITDINAFVNQMGGRQIVGISTITAQTSGALTPGTTGSGAASLPNMPGATDFMIIPYVTGWCNVSNITRAGNTITVNFLNTSPGTYSGFARLYVIGYKVAER